MWVWLAIDYVVDGQGAASKTIDFNWRGCVDGPRPISDPRFCFLWISFVVFLFYNKTVNGFVWYGVVGSVTGEEPLGSDLPPAAAAA